uniref:OmpA family protein n=1 Tax=uncultured Draconibacterium sp. TaxID=1573823 RepID=UPI003216C9AD
MKSTNSFIAIALVLLFAASVNAQVKSVEKEVERQGTRRINRKIDKGINKGFDKIEDGIGSLFGKKKSNKKAEQVNTLKEENSQSGSGNSSAQIVPKAQEMNVEWSRFDFVPGDEVIFEDGPGMAEENGEFPSRWDLVGGVVEIASMNNETVMMFREGDYSDGIIPYLKNSKEDYLPNVFTIEFDCFFGTGYSGRYFVSFYDRKNQKYSGEGLDINVNAMELGDSEQTYPGRERSNTDETGGWRHISIAYTKGKMKCYMDDTRLINIPHYEGNPTGLTLAAEVSSSDETKKFIKNIRIAKGGVKYYDRVMQDGKIICNGIRFEVGKATLKPESMGPINKIYELMTKQADLKFSVEGHTDADGDETKNQTLSEQRAKTVMEQLVSMGISADRLSSKGFGEKTPLDDNNTSEGKANNRRVEFVKF